MKHPLKELFDIVLGSLGLLWLITATTVHAETIQWKNGRWFDGQTFVEKTYYSADGHLTTTRPRSVSRSIDIKGKFVVPAFGDAHHHGVDSLKGLDAKINAFLKVGVFYVKNPNVIADLLTPAVRAKLNRPTSIDVAFSNGGLTASGGHPIALHQYLSANGMFAGLTPADMENRAYFVIDSADDLTVKWPRIVATKPDFIKTYLLFSEEFAAREHAPKKAKGLNPALLKLIVAAARAEGLRVTTHVDTAADFRHAVAAGVDEINHLPMPNLAFSPDLSAYVIDQVTAERAAKLGIVVIATASIEERFAPAGSLGSDVINALRGNVRKNLNTLHAAGVRIGVGSDGISGETPFATGFDEALYLSRNGFFDNLSLLKMWSEVTPRTIFPKRKIGALTEGYEANFLVLDGNPLINFENVRLISLRVKLGRVLSTNNARQTLRAAQSRAHTSP